MMLVRTLSRHWLYFLLLLKEQLSIDTLSYQCTKGLWAVGLAVETSIGVWGSGKWWEKVSHVTVTVLCKRHRRFKERVSLGCKKRSGGSTGYQKCDSSDILLLEDNSTLPSVGRISAFSMMYDRWLWLFFFFFLVAIIWNMTPYR